MVVQEMEWWTTYSAAMILYASLVVVEVSRTYDISGRSSRPAVSAQNDYGLYAAIAVPLDFFDSLLYQGEMR